MAYTKTDWQARLCAHPNRYAKSGETAISVVLTNDPGAVTVPGTPFSAENMNHIERGIAGAHEAAEAESQARAEGDAALAESVATESQARAEGDSALAQSVATESQARAEGDAALAQSLTTEARARLEGDAALAQSLAALKAETAKIILPKSGYFGLYVNSSGELKTMRLRLKVNGDLVATAMDGEPNPFRYDPETGNLYCKSGEDN
jgi:DNA-binding TFAR19-related protein (PDSD5 family)